MRVPTVQEINAVIAATETAGAGAISPDWELVAGSIQKSDVMVVTMPHLLIEGCRDPMQAVFEAIIFGMYLAYQLAESKQMEETFK